MDAIKTLEDLLAKTARNTSNANRKRVVDALQTQFAEDGNHKQVIGYLIRFHYSVCQAFFENLCSSASEENILAFAEALVNDEQFNKDKPNHIMYPKGLSAVLALAAGNQYQASFQILNRILANSEKLGGFSDGCVNNFKKLIVDKEGMPFILNLFEQVTKDEIMGKEFEQRRLARFLTSLDDKVVVTKREEAALTASSSVAGQAQGQPGITPVTSQQSEKNIPNEVEAIIRIDKTQQEILALMRRMADNSSNMELLSSSIVRRDEEILLLKSDLTDKEQHAASLAIAIERKEEQLVEMQEQIGDLTERLRTALQMDEIAKNQELITLKNDISEALKLDYADFVKSKERAYSEDLFEAYRLTLVRIFKLLKRFGITCQ